MKINKHNLLFLFLFLNRRESSGEKKGARGEKALHIEMHRKLA